MGRNRTINHRSPPRSAKRPRIVRPRDGKLVEVSPEPVYEPETVVQLRKQLQTAEREAAEATRMADIRMKEITALKQVVQNARDEALAARQEQKEENLQRHLPQSVELLQLDDITRTGDSATMTGLAKVDDAVGELQLTLPVGQIRQLIKRKKQDGKARQAKVPEVRRSSKTSDVSD